MKIYHGTFDKWADNIINNGFKKPNIRNTDNHWLGHGIYFYDNIEEALEWANSKVRAYQNKRNEIHNSQVIISDVRYQDIVNLNMSCCYKKFESFAIEFDIILKTKGLSLDYTKGLSKDSHNYQNEINKRKRCLILDAYVKDKNIKALMYTFNMRKQNTSNDSAKFLLMGLNQTQICVYDISILHNIRKGKIEKGDFIC